MCLDGTVSSKMKRQGRLPDVILFQCETVLNKSRDSLAFKVLTNLSSVLPDGMFGGIKGHGVAEHKLEVDKQSVCVDVDFSIDAIFDVAKADGLKDDLVVLWILSSTGECLKVFDEGIATRTDDATKVLDELTKGSFETLASFARAFASVKETAFGELGRVAIVGVPVIIVVTIGIGVIVICIISGGTGSASSRVGLLALLTSGRR